jgi:hypothetical protein
MINGFFVLVTSASLDNNTRIQQRRCQAYSLCGCDNIGRLSRDYGIKASAGRHGLRCHVRDTGFQGDQRRRQEAPSMLVRISCLSVVKDAILMTYSTRYSRPCGRSGT